MRQLQTLINPQPLAGDGVTLLYVNLELISHFGQIRTLQHFNFWVPPPLAAHKVDLKITQLVTKTDKPLHKRDKNLFTQFGCRE